MVSWARSTQPFELGLPALMRHWRARSASTGAAELARGELGAVIGRHLAELPAGRLELARDAVDQLDGPARPGVALGGVQLGPDEAGGDVGGGVLPDGALRARQPPDEEAVELHLLAGHRRVDVALRRRQLGLALVGLGVASHQAQPLRARVQVETAQHPPDAVL